MEILEHGHLTMLQKTIFMLNPNIKPITLMRVLEKYQLQETRGMSLFFPDCIMDFPQESNYFKLYEFIARQFSSAHFPSVNFYQAAVLNLTVLQKSVIIDDETLGYGKMCNNRHCRNAVKKYLKGV